MTPPKKKRRASASDTGRRIATLGRKNPASQAKKKRPRKPLSEEGKPGRYDARNTLNDLTGKEWLLLTASFWTTEGSPEDRTAYAHPAPFMVRDVEKLIRLFTKAGMTVLDPFAGSGTTILAALRSGRKAVAIDINPEYKELARKRLADVSAREYTYLVGDARKKLNNVGTVDYVVTSPPYHNILRNQGNGTRAYTGKLYRMSAREGVSYYTEFPNDLGNLPSLDDFFVSLREIMTKVLEKLRDGRYCTVVMSDFTVDKKEVAIQARIIQMMEQIGFDFSGTTVLLQPVKPLYPFGYPYAYKINHHHQNLMTFRKPPSEAPQASRNGRSTRKG